VKKGLKFRSLETTIRDTLEWQKKRPEDEQVLKAGLTMQREAELLANPAQGPDSHGYRHKHFQDESKITETMLRTPNCFARWRQRRELPRGL
jgi:hypothetical protein